MFYLFGDAEYDELGLLDGICHLVHALLFGRFGIPDLVVLELDGLDHAERIASRVVGVVLAWHVVATIPEGHVVLEAGLDVLEIAQRVGQAQIEARQADDRHDGEHLLDGDDVKEAAALQKRRLDLAGATQQRRAEQPRLAGARLHAVRTRKAEVVLNAGERLVDERLDRLVYEIDNVLGLDAAHAQLECGARRLMGDESDVAVLLQPRAELPYARLVAVCEQAHLEAVEEAGRHVRERVEHLELAVARRHVAHVRPGDSVRLLVRQ